MSFVFFDDETILGWNNDDWDDDDQGPRWLWLWVVGAIIVGTALLFAAFFLFRWLFIWLGSFLGLAWIWSINSLQSWIGVALGVAFLICISRLLFEFRCRYLFYYGILEICFSIFASVNAVLSVRKVPEIGHWIAVVGAMYLTVRGFNNIREASRPKVTEEQVMEIVMKEMQSHVKARKTKEAETGTPPPDI